MHSAHKEIQCYNYFFLELPSPPTNLTLNNINGSIMTFSWNVVMPEACNEIHYVINATNCGMCSSTTLTSASCQDFAISDVSVCEFALRTVYCVDITGPMSNTTAVILKGTIIAAG